jgi:hypothetical protein
MATAKEMVTSRSSSSPLDAIKIALAKMATLRRADLDLPTIELYSERLSKEPTRDVITALEKMQEWPREQGETAMPEIGAILGVVKTCEVARKNRETGAGKTVLVAHECPKCGYRSSSFVRPENLSGTYCRRCPTAMNEIHRENLA